MRNLHQNNMFNGALSTHSSRSYDPIHLYGSYIMIEDSAGGKQGIIDRGFKKGNNTQLFTVTPEKYNYKNVFPIVSVKTNKETIESWLTSYSKVGFVFGKLGRRDTFTLNFCKQLQSHYPNVNFVAMYVSCWDYQKVEWCSTVVDDTLPKVQQQGKVVENRNGTLRTIPSSFANHLFEKWKIEELDRSGYIAVSVLEIAEARNWKMDNYYFISSAVPEKAISLISERRK